MATIKFKSANSFGRVGVTEFPLHSTEEVELVKQFMLRIAPELTQNSLRTDMPASDCAEQALYWAMCLTAKYTQFQHEALKALAEESTPDPGLIEKTSQTAANVQQAASQLSERTHDLRSLRQSSSEPDPSRSWQSR